jgi:MFS transporter, FSR family, fosmidomycin resistance protein
MFFLFTGFLLIPWFGAKVVLLALMGLWNSGWYAIPQARLYATLPGRSGIAMAATSAFGILAGGIPLILGAVAQQFGLGITMWLLLAGPLGLLLLLPSGGSDPASDAPPASPANEGHTNAKGDRP